jgi:hypothetical protein
VAVEAETAAPLDTEEAGQAEAKQEPEAVAEELPQEEETLYRGEVVLLIPAGADEQWMFELRRCVSSTPGLRIRAESGEGERTTAVNLLLDRPLALVSVLRQLPDVQAIVDTPIEEGVKQGRRARWLSRDDSLRRALTVELQGDSAGQASRA